ncbi:MAG: dihydrofolate reductase [Ignavibacteriales bacterium]|nr:MAG: dihydrofolate reductase [Ignavibacteriales bacterium]
MKRISVFNYISLDGFFAGPNGEIDWFYNLPKDDEWESYTQSAAGASRTLMYGRTTYEMMKSYWPTMEAIKSFPEMANAINNNPKIVFSKTLTEFKEEENWKNVIILNDINREEILKQKEKDDIVILGSGSIIQQLANLDLIDEYTVVIVPIILGNGKSFFKNVNTTNLDLVEARSFKNGIIFLSYKRKELR